MPQPKLDALLIALSKRAGDDVSSASADGDTLTAAKRLEYINRGRGTAYTKVLAMHKDVMDLLDKYPEFKSKVSLTVSNNDAAKTSAAQRMLVGRGLLIQDGQDNKLSDRIPQESRFEAEYDEDSMYFATSDEPKLYELEDKIEILGPTVTSGSLKCVFLLQPTDVAQGGANADIIEPKIWFDTILEEAYSILEKDLQKK